MGRSTLALAFAVFASTASVAYAQDELWVIDCEDNLNSIDTSTLRSTTVGHVSSYRVSALATARDGTLYALGSAGNELVRVDPLDGSGTLVTNVSSSISYSSGMAIDPVTDRIYVAGPGVGPNTQVYELDRVTGAMTPVLETTTACLTGLEFDATGSLAGIDGCTANGLVQIDLAAGSVTAPSSGALLGWPGVNGFAVGASGTTYAISSDGRLLTIDPTTGDASTLGVIEGLPLGVAPALTAKLPAKQLYGAPGQLSVGLGGSHQLEVRFGAEHGGKAYRVLGSASGAAPGFALTGTSVPLNPDPYLAFTALQPNTPLLSGSGGVLDSAGGAITKFTLPPGSDAALIGVNVHHAAILIEVSGIAVVAGHATGAEACLLVP